MNRQEKRRKYNAQEVKTLEQVMLIEGQNQGIESSYASTLLILHDKYEFTPEQCKEFLEEVSNQVECIMEKRVNYEDIKKVISDELGINIVRRFKHE